ncbi:MAG: type II toxin-antitoxin system RelE/ParE family toxin [Campylobacterales bacterium]|nr:type II toxin-antitoxin system RelE/ParE family toxin [Campylobacterales bacterium]
MIIKYSERFESEFFEIYIFIAIDSISKAVKFKNELKKSIENILDMPYKHRKSVKIDDESIRELVFKKYVIVYKIYEDEIWILGIFNQNLWDL